LSALRGFWSGAARSVQSGVGRHHGTRLHAVIGTH
jgi:hypothetical protein